MCWVQRTLVEAALRNNIRILFFLQPVQYIKIRLKLVKENSKVILKATMGKQNFQVKN